MKNSSLYSAQSLDDRNEGAEWRELYILTSPLPSWSVGQRFGIRRREREKKTGRMIKTTQLRKQRENGGKERRKVGEDSPKKTLEGNETGQNRRCHIGDRKRNRRKKAEWQKTETTPNTISYAQLATRVVKMRNTTLHSAQSLADSQV